MPKLGFGGTEPSCDWCLYLSSRCCLYLSGGQGVNSITFLMAQSTCLLAQKKSCLFHWTHTGGFGLCSTVPSNSTHAGGRTYRQTCFCWKRLTLLKCSVKRVLHHLYCYERCIQIYVQKVELPVELLVQV